MSGDNQSEIASTQYINKITLCQRNDVDHISEKFLTVLMERLQITKVSSLQNLQTEEQRQNFPMEFQVIVCVCVFCC